jgi:hypothetical protein
MQDEFTWGGVYMRGITHVVDQDGNILVEGDDLSGRLFGFYESLEAAQAGVESLHAYRADKARRKAEEDAILTPEVRACPNRGTPVTRPIIRHSAVATDWSYGEIEPCPICGAKAVPAFSKYFKHP